MALGKVAEYKIRNIIETITDEKSRQKALQEHQAFQNAMSEQDRKRQEESFANLANTLSVSLGKEIDISSMIKLPGPEALDALAAAVQKAISEGAIAGINSGLSAANSALAKGDTTTEGVGDSSGGSIRDSSVNDANLGSNITNAKQPEDVPRNIGGSDTQQAITGLATENTLLGIKSTVEIIKNQSQRGNDTGGSTSIDARLSEILSAIRGNSHATGTGNDSNPAPKTPDSNSQGGQKQGQDKQKQNDNTNLQNQYKRLGELRAEIENAPKGQYLKYLQEQLGVTEELIKAENKRLKISPKQEAKYSKKADDAYNKKKAQLDAKAAKQADKDADKEFKQQVRDAKKDAVLSNAESSLKGADKTILSARSNLNFDKFSGDFKTLFAEYESQANQFKNKYASIAHEISKTGIVTDKQRNDLLQQSTLTDKYTEKIKNLVAEYDRLSGENVKTIGTNAIMQEPSMDASNEEKEKYLESYRKQLVDTVMKAENGKAAIKGFDASTKTLTYTVQTGKHEFTEYSATVRNADNALVSVRGETKRAETAFEKLRRKTKEVATYLTSSMSIYTFINQIKQGIQYINEIDKAMTELKKVTDETDEVYEKFLNTASSTGAKIGSTISEFTQATAEFARLGYDINLASQMAEAAVIYTNVGDDIENAADASKSIISAIKGFGMEASDSMAVIDRFNEVGNNFAITSVGIGEALQRSASALHAAGNTIDESIGLITAANSVVQDPTTVGTALKTLSLRVRGAKVELEEAGEDIDGMAKSTSELQQKLLALTGGKVDIMLDEN